jgi:hypothetical protein
MKWMCMPLGRYVLAAVVGLAASLGMAAPQPPALRSAQGCSAGADAAGSNPVAGKDGLLGES